MGPALESAARDNVPATPTRVSAARGRRSARQRPRFVIAARAPRPKPTCAFAPPTKMTNFRRNTPPETT